MCWPEAAHAARHGRPGDRPRSQTSRARHPDPHASSSRPYCSYRCGHCASGDAQAGRHPRRLTDALGGGRRGAILDAGARILTPPLTTLIRAETTQPGSRARKLGAPSPASTCFDTPTHTHSPALHVSRALLARKNRFAVARCISQCTATALLRSRSTFQPFAPPPSVVADPWYRRSMTTKFRPPFECGGLCPLPPPSTFHFPFRRLAPFIRTVHSRCKPVSRQ